VSDANALVFENISSKLRRIEDISRVLQAPTAAARTKASMNIRRAAVTMLRIALGVLLVVAGALKIGHALDLAASIASFRLLPPAIVAPLAVALPFVEIFVGLYLAIGLFTRWAAVLAALQFGLYGIAVASAVLRGLAPDCGCFGPNDRATADWPHAAFDFALALCATLVAIYAPGSLALDRRISTP